MFAAAAAKSYQSCPTLCDPHRRQPTRLLRPWDSPGKNWSGLPFPSPMYESEKWKWSRLVVSDSSLSHGLQPTRLFYPWDFPGKSTGVGCHCFLQQVLFKLPLNLKKSNKHYAFFSPMLIDTVWQGFFCVWGDYLTYDTLLDLYRLLWFFAACSSHLLACMSHIHT